MWYVKADFDRTWTRTDFDRRAYQASIQPSSEGFSVFNTHDNSYLLSFDKPETAKAFAEDNRITIDFVLKMGFKQVKREDGFAFFEAQKKDIPYAI